MAKKRSFKPNWLLIGGGLAAAYYVWKSQAAKKINGIGAMEMNLPNFHLIEVKYLSPTNISPAKIKISSKRFKSSKTMPYNYSFNSPLDQALNYITDKGFKIIGVSGFGDTDFIISSTFDNIK